MKRATLDLLGCPVCHEALQFTGSEQEELGAGVLFCPGCQQRFPVVDGIPHFVEPAALSGFNRQFSRMYDRLSWLYRAFSKVAFAYIGMSEEVGRREITDRLDPCRGRVLEVSIGPGVNLPFLMNREDVGEVFGLDISLGQLRQCQSYVANKGWQVDLFLGKAEQLPFRDNTFQGVFHVGGINFFNDKQAAIEEMIRVSAPGAKILIADETEKGARGYERFFPGFRRSVGGRRSEIVAPVDLVPTQMVGTRVLEVWKGWLYCIEFSKPYEVEIR